MRNKAGCLRCRRIPCRFFPAIPFFCNNSFILPLAKGEVLSLDNGNCNAALTQ